MAFVDIFTTGKKYKVIYADPPWDYVQSGSKKIVVVWQNNIIPRWQPKIYANYL